MLCVKLGHWPFEKPPHLATAAQVNLLTHVYLSTLPKVEDKGSRAPHGKLDKETMKQWKQRIASQRGEDG
jgi:hypothetical protein